MELFEICSNLETVCAELSRLCDLMNICEEGITECAEILRDGDGLSKYAPALALCFRLLESKANFVGAQATLYREITAAFLFSRNVPPATNSKEKLWNNFGTQPP